MYRVMCVRSQAVGATWRGALHNTLEAPSVVHLLKERAASGEPSWRNLCSPFVLCRMLMTTARFIH
jgi:hypothetical protein